MVALQYRQVRQIADSSPDAPGLPIVVEPLYEIRLDEQTGVIHVTLIGQWTLLDVQGYRETLGRFVRHVRERGDNIRLIFDIRAADPQSPEVSNRFKSCVDLFPSPDDRFAFVVGSSVVKTQIRLLASARSKAFLSLSAALTWLSAHG